MTDVIHRDGERTQVWQVPEPLAVHDARLGDGAVIALRRHGNPSGPRIVLSHGNSLAIDLYYPFWSQFADACDLVVYDLRNHGWNAPGPLRSHHVPTLIDDHLRIQDAIEQGFGKKPQAGVFHSLSGLVSLLSPTRGGEFTARVLFDPPLGEFGPAREECVEVARRAAKMTLTRAERYPTRAEFAEVLREMLAFQHVVPGVRRLMARTTLRRSPDGDGYILRCPREYEAQIYRYGGQYAALIDFGALACPTMVMGADPAIPHTYFPTTELHHIPTVDYAYLPGGTHLLQLEQPEASAAATLDYLKANGLF
ncbi:MAG: alpha/beta hydrolase [Gemmatimonadales bacterium]|nr:alpha/beta hydrolase [Gemmatimonadales bacterium]MYL06988.1 alpha/beta hydrolase [Gemmatimonadales bacterium]